MLGQMHINSDTIWYNLIHEIIHVFIDIPSTYLSLDFIDIRSKWCWVVAQWLLGKKPLA